MKSYDKTLDCLFNTTTQVKNSLLSEHRIKEYLRSTTGWVYIAQSKDNRLFKIGRTASDPSLRAKTLSSAGVLSDYEILFALQCPNQFLAESAVHQNLSKYRIKKEFFSVDLQRATKAISQEVSTQTSQILKYISSTELQDVYEEKNSFKETQDFKSMKKTI